VILLNFIINRAVNLWNNLPDYVIMATSVSTFKKRLVKTDLFTSWSVIDYSDSIYVLSLYIYVLSFIAVFFLCLHWTV
jgi:hypothetical protein